MDKNSAPDGKVHQPTTGPAKEKKPYKPPSFTLKHLDPIRMDQLFYDGENQSKLPKLPKGKTASEWGTKGKDARMLAKFCNVFARLEKEDLSAVFFMAQKLAKRKRAVKRALAQDATRV